MPLEIADGTSGVLAMSSAIANYFSPADLGLLQFVAYQVALVARERASHRSA